MIEVNNDNFDKEVLERSKEIPVLVDFWTEWCAPCLILGPILEKLSKNYDNKLIFVKVNVDANREISARYGISAIPNIKLFKNGEVANEFIGALPESDVKKFLDSNIS